MSTARKIQPISVNNYLEGELSSDIKHEYIGGAVYAMAGGTNAHNLIASNCTGALYSRLRGSKCRVYNADTKIRIRRQTHDLFYYPDASVICRPNSPNDTFQDDPAIVIEVLSRTTRRIDEGEKKEAYLSIPTLSAYLLIEQDEAAVVAHRRTQEGFTRETFVGLDSAITLDSVEIELPLSEIYESVNFADEPDLKQ